VNLTFDSRTGLIPAIAQDRLTGEVRMLAYMNRESLELTLATGKATFWSRERQSLWVKGETSGHVLQVHSVLCDCDADTLVLMVDPVGPSCHTGRPSCFFRRLDNLGELVDEPTAARPMLHALEAVIERRQASTAEKSYTRSLLDAGAPKIGAKLREEADELARAIADESDERVLAESADLLFHMLVGLRSRGLDLRGALAVLDARTGTSGHAEKASRAAKPT
jgi:phosphoribosyl-AMP cyclohydrolase / phosphoribosyl-ATP pyrophosphohydrolase